MNNKKEFNYTIAISHKGKFHSDDIFSFGMSRLINPDIKIKRFSDTELNNTLFEKSECPLIFDTGRGEYDHHQLDAKLRSDGEKYSSFGLLWKDYGYLLIEDDYIRDKFDKEFVAMIDHSDNNPENDQVTILINEFMPITESDNLDQCCDKAIEFATGILERKIKYYNRLALTRSMIKDMEKKHTGWDTILVLDKYEPGCEEYIDDNRFKFIVYPSLRGDFSGKIVSDIKFSENFIKEGVDLDSIIPDLTFCHTSRFMVAGKTKESCIAACQYSINRTIMLY